MAAFTIGAWVRTPDGQGEIVGHDAAEERPYYVQLDRPGVDGSADNLVQYAAAELTRATPPAWRRMRDRERRG